MGWTSSINNTEPTTKIRTSPQIQALMRDPLQELKPISILDLAAGSGEVSRCVLQWAAETPNSKSVKNTGAAVHLDAIDPYTFQAYERAIQRPCQRQSFADIAAHGLSRNYELIICSFALHLASPSLLYAVCVQLALKSRFLIILTPHKRPQIGESMGWSLQHEVLENKVRRRLYVNNRMFSA